MKTTCKLILILSLIILLSNCRKEKFFNVPVVYLPVYAIGDTLIYSNGKVNDTLMLKSINNYEAIYDEKDHYQRAVYSFEKPNYNSASNKEFYMFYYTEKQVGIGFGKFDDILLFTNTNSKEMQVNNKVYSNVFRLTSDFYDSSRSAINTVFFNYKYLVVRYVNNNNDTFDLVN